MAPKRKSENERAAKLLSAAHVRSVFGYDPQSGALTWKAPRPRVTVGMVAGHTKANGYKEVKLDGVSYKVHVLIWLYMTGAWPKAQVDHRDLDRGNNRWENLREATTSQNKANSAAYRSNQSGLKGVYRRHGSKYTSRPFSAQIRVRGHLISLGYFSTAEEAHAAYVRAARQHFGEFARF